LLTHLLIRRHSDRFFLFKVRIHDANYFPHVGVNKSGWYVKTKKPRAQRVDYGRGSKEHRRADDMSTTVSPALPTFVLCPKKFVPLINASNSLRSKSNSTEEWSVKKFANLFVCPLRPFGSFFRQYSLLILRFFYLI
jgi:hypothetical protein